MNPTKNLPIHTPFYYGWVIVCISAISLFFLDQVKPTPSLFLLIIILKTLAGAVLLFLAFILLLHYSQALFYSS